jgi:hypothetical protein
LKLSPEEERESYNIYSALLKMHSPPVNKWAIIQETRAWRLCLRSPYDPGRIYGPVYGPVFDDYDLKNKKTLILVQKFTLPSYTLVPPEEWREYLSGSGTNTFAVFSAVGFNQDRTRAVVCFWAQSSGTCRILIKRDGAWKFDQDWKGGGCDWAA